MACVHIEDVPDNLAEALDALARRRHRTVSQVAVGILRRALLSPRARQGVLFAEVDGPPRRQRAAD